MKHTKIEWAHHTFNPWVGCTKVGPACERCYAQSWAKRTGHPELWQGERRRTTAENWQQLIKWDRAAAAAGVRERVFPSLCDPFDNQVPERWRDDFWHRIEQTPNLDWMLLTKRPENIARMLPNPATGVKPWGNGWPNVWLGISAGSQTEANRTIPILLEISAAVHFASLEPLLGPTDLTAITFKRVYGTGLLNALTGEMRGHVPNSPLGSLNSRLDLVIAGGETGPRARPMHPDGPRSLRDQCVASGTSFFFKGWGAWAPVSALDDETIESIYHPAPKRNPDARRVCKVASHVLHADGSQHDIVEPMAFAAGKGAMTMFRVGPAAAGCELDGRTWRQMPDTGQRPQRKAGSDPVADCSYQDAAMNVMP